MARFRLGLAGAFILAFLSVWSVRHQPCCLGASIAALPAAEAVSEDGRVPGEAPASAPSSATDDPSDDLWSVRRASSLRAPDRSWWRIGPPTADADLRRARARSTGPPLAEG